MDLSMMILEVDGSIHNPAVAWAIGIWSALLVTVAILSGRRFRHNRRSRLITVAVILAIITPIPVKLIASLFYVLPAKRAVVVHFWGFSEWQWLAPLVSLFVFLVVASWPRTHVAAV